MAEPSLSERLAVFLLLAQTLSKAAKIPEATKVRYTMCFLQHYKSSIHMLPWHCTSTQDFCKQLIVAKVSVLVGG